MDTESDGDVEKGDTTPKKKLIARKVLKDHHRKTKYNPAWEIEFRNWLRRVPNDIYKAYCTVCNTSFCTEISTIRRHSKSVSHLQKARTIEGCSTVDKVSN